MNTAADSISCKELKRRAWENLKRNKCRAIGVTAAMLAIEALGVWLALVAFNNRAIGLLVGVVLWAVLRSATTKFFLALTLDGEISSALRTSIGGHLFRDVWRWLRNVVNLAGGSVGMFFCLFFIAFLSLIGILALHDLNPFEHLWKIAYELPLIPASMAGGLFFSAIALRIIGYCGFAPFLLSKESIGVVEKKCLNSANVSQITLDFRWWGLLCGVTLCIACLWVLPYWWLTLAEYYKKLMSEHSDTAIESALASETSKSPEDVRP